MTKEKEGRTSSKRKRTETQATGFATAVTVGALLSPIEGAVVVPTNDSTTEPTTVTASNISEITSTSITAGPTAFPTTSGFIPPTNVTTQGDGHSGIIFGLGLWPLIGIGVGAVATIALFGYLCKRYGAQQVPPPDAVEATIDPCPVVVNTEPTNALAEPPSLPTPCLQNPDLNGAGLDGAQGDADRQPPTSHYHHYRRRTTRTTYFVPQTEFPGEILGAFPARGASEQPIPMRPLRRQPNHHSRFDPISRSSRPDPVETSVQSAMRRGTTERRVYADEGGHGQTFFNRNASPPSYSQAAAADVRNDRDYYAGGATYGSSLA